MRLALAAVAALVLMLGLGGGSAPAQDFTIQIVGGTTAEPGDYPWQVALYKQQGGLFQICGGTLIADTKVVTAAHCTSGSAGSLKVLVGSQTLTTSGLINVSSYADHPSYNSSTFDNDVSVLQLAGSGIAAGGEPIDLIGEEGSSDDEFWAAGDILAISGWGDTSEGGSGSTQLREAEVPRVADTQCDDPDWYGSEFHAATMVCAGPAAGGVDTCQGDSGGPLVAPRSSSFLNPQDDPSQWSLVGVTSWGDGCARAKKPGVYTRLAAPAIRNFVLGFPLNVSLAGTGTGTVTSSPSGINCGSDCTESYSSGTVVTLTAAPASNSVFTGWGGACSGSTTTCQVTMSQARNVTATFEGPRTLTVSKDGAGSGTVMSDPAGITCGIDCSESFNYNTAVTLTATPAAGSIFTGWSGACTNSTGTCQVTMTQARSVTATFTQDPALPQHTLTFAKGGTGTGTVTSSPSGINCGTGCSGDSHDYSEGTVVTLTASPASDSDFTGWSGACTNTSGTCQVTMDQARSVTATFAAKPQHTLSVSRAGTGTGTVTSSPTGISCGSDCLQDYVEGTVVTLTASPSSDSTFTGWSGGCTNSSGTCQVTMTAAKNVTATFTAKPQHALAVSKTGDGGGIVTGSGIDCGSDCSQSYVEGTVVTLNAAAAGGSSFAGWEGACGGSATTCHVTMSQARNVTARFNSHKSLTVSKSGDGTGTVTSVPGGIDCGSSCAAQFSHGTAVTLTPSAGAGSSFTGWSGACSGTDICLVTMDQARRVTATFTATNTGSGTGDGDDDPTDPDAPFSPAVDTTAPRITFTVTRLNASLTGYVRLPVGCPAAEPAACAGRVTLRLLSVSAGTSAGRIVGKTSFRVAPGAKKRVRLRLTRYARQRLARRGRITVRTIFVVTDAAGNSRTVRRKVTIRRAS